MAMPNDRCPVRRHRAALRNANGIGPVAKRPGRFRASMAARASPTDFVRAAPAG
jgi:hypothetical protein